MRPTPRVVTMAMTDRPEVRTASGPVAGVTLMGLGENLVNALASNDIGDAMDPRGSGSPEASSTQR